MNFKDVYEELINGKKIRRKSWKEGSWININNLKTLGKERNNGGNLNGTNVFILLEAMGKQNMTFIFQRPIKGK